MVDVSDATDDVDNAAIKAEPGESSGSTVDPGEPVITTDIPEAVDSKPPTKKTRLEANDERQDGTGHDVLKSPSILKLPLELLSEVLIRTGSPEHVLAVARTCKSLCHTLLSRDAEFIWRETRRSPSIMFQHENITCKLPDPPAEFFNEVAYAAFIFSPGNCDVSRSCYSRIRTHFS